MTCYRYIHICISHSLFFLSCSRLGNGKGPGVCGRRSHLSLGLSRVSPYLSVSVRGRECAPMLQRQLRPSVRRGFSAASAFARPLSRSLRPCSAVLFSPRSAPPLAPCPSLLRCHRCRCCCCCCPLLCSAPLLPVPYRLSHRSPPSRCLPACLPACTMPRHS
jgi:hypothetical protein